MLLSKYEYFLAIAEFKNITKASEKLYLSQPSLSQYLIKLENEIGARLFERKNNQMELTYAGERYLDYVNKLVELDLQMRHEFDEIKTSGHEELLLGFTSWKGTYMLPSLLPIFLEKYPNIDLKIQEEVSSKLVDLIMNNKLDVCILNAYKYDPELVYNALLEEKLLLVCKKNNSAVKNLETSLQSPAVFDIEKLSNETFLVQAPAHVLLTEMVENFFKQKNFKPKRSIAVNNITTILDLAVSGIGFAFVPQLIVEQYKLKDELAILDADPPLFWTVSVTYKKDGYLSKAAKDFIDIAKAYYAK